jgi:predicted PurR-regulated permease PerM
MIAVLTIAIVILSLFVIYLIRHIKLINNELTAIDKEQHTQNMDIIRLMKLTNEISSISEEHDKALLAIIQHLSKQDLTSFPYMGVVGEA